MPRNVLDGTVPLVAALWAMLLAFVSGGAAGLATSITLHAVLDGPLATGGKLLLVADVSASVLLAGAAFFMLLGGHEAGEESMHVSRQTLDELRRRGL